MAKEKIMPLELLASIKGATSSEAVNELFEVIRKAIPNRGDQSHLQENKIIDAIPVDNLRSDVVAESTDAEKELIKKNFPAAKNGLLVVPKVIED